MTNVTRQELEACARLLGLPLMLGRVQLCGCVVCVCDDEIQCQGCGAQHCGKHPVGEIPNPNYEFNLEDYLALASAAKLNICYEADFVALPASCPKVGKRLYGWPSDGTESECILHAAAAVQAEREKQQ